MTDTMTAAEFVQAQYEAVKTAYVRQKMVKLGSTNEVPDGAANTSGATSKGLAPMPSKNTIPRICVQCDKQFLAFSGNVRQGGGKFCSRDCYHAFRSDVPLKSLVERFTEKYAIEPSGCWVWQASLNNKGYARIRNYGGTELAHRVAYELFRGPIPDGMDLDHLCRNPACVNPDHLEAVSRWENLKRGISPTIRLHLQGVCKRSHEINDQNTCFRKGTRKVVYCKVCRREDRAQQRDDGKRASAARG